VDAATVKTKLVKILQEIQATSGLPCPDLNDATRPIEDLDEFDSKIWPVAAGMLAAELGIEIADDVNIFRREKTKTALTINETTAMVVKIADAASAANALEATA
jgi:hypothetical protein